MPNNKRLPAPLVSARVDLRSFPCLMVDVKRLRDSTFNAIASDAEYRAASNLWYAAFHSFPAASIPDPSSSPKDNKVVAAMAGLGQNLEKWEVVKEVALHNFVLCSDGRLYHPVVAEFANKAWEVHYKNKSRTKAALAARWPRKNSVGSRPRLRNGRKEEEEAKEKKNPVPTGRVVCDAPSNGRGGFPPPMNGREGAEMASRSIGPFSVEDIGTLQARWPELNVPGMVENLLEGWATEEKMPDPADRKRAVVNLIGKKGQEAWQRARERERDAARTGERRAETREARKKDGPPIGNVVP